MAGAGAAFPAVSELNRRTLNAATGTTDDCIQWLRGIGLLATNKNCTQCGTPMQEVNDIERKDGKRWRCPVKACKKECSIREGSFLGDGSKLELKDIIDLLYYCAYDFNDYVKTMKRECGLGSEAIINWRNYIRNILAEYFLQHSSQIGGPGHIVEMVELEITRQKDKVGRVGETQWVVGGIDNKTKEGFIVALPHRDAATLLPILQRYVLPSTTIISDMWERYNTINNEGYQYLLVNHNINFVDSVTTATRNHVGSMWCRAKLRYKKECNAAQSLMDSYFIEYMWRMQFGHDPFENLVSCIRDVYKL